MAAGANAAPPDPGIDLTGYSPNILSQYLGLTGATGWGFPVNLTDFSDVDFNLDISTSDPAFQTFRAVQAGGALQLSLGTQLTSNIPGVFGSTVGINGNFTVDTTDKVLFVNVTTNRVGVLTDAPAFGLDVRSTEGLNVATVANPTTPALRATPGATPLVLMGTDTAPATNVNARADVIGGRLYVAPASEVLAIGVRYVSTAGTYSIGATNSATPDMVFSNNAGTATGQLTNLGSMILPGVLSLVAPSIAVQTHRRDVYSDGSGNFAVTNDGASGVHATIDTSGNGGFAGGLSLGNASLPVTLTARLDIKQSADSNAGGIRTIRAATTAWTALYTSSAGGSVLENAGGSITVSSAGALVVPGAFNHTGSTFGSYNVTPATRPSAYTLTYSTATKVQAGITSSAVATNVTTNVSPWGMDTQQHMNDVVNSINAIRDDLSVVKQITNQIITDLTALGLLQ